MAFNGLAPEAWKAIRLAYEFDPDEPSVEAAAKRAADKYKFRTPSRQAVYNRFRDDAARGDPWERRANLNGINQAAQRKADNLVDSQGKPTETDPKKKVLADREQSEDARAEVLARHRTEWRQVAALRQEAVSARKTSVSNALDLIRLAKTVAETTKLQQDGERRAWGMDEQGTLVTAETVRLYLPDNGR